MNGFDINSFEDMLLCIKSETASMLLADLMDEEKAYTSIVQRSNQISGNE